MRFAAGVRTMPPGRGRATRRSCGVAVGIDLRGALRGESAEINPCVVLIYGRQPVLRSGGETGIAPVAAERAFFARSHQPPVARALPERMFQHRHGTPRDGRSGPAMPAARRT